MSFLTDIWRQLVRRRLWPVAVLLLAALAAVPVLLAKEPTVTVETAAPAPAPAATASSELTEAPIVAASDASNRARGHKPLGKSHDIFKSTAKKPKAAKVEKVEKAKVAETVKQEDTKSSSSTGSGGAATPDTPVEPTTPAPKPKTYPLYSLSVRFGSSDGASGKRTLSRDQALPSTAEPLLIYLGLLRDHKTAVFLLDASTTAQGDGACHPTPESCETLRLKVGETEFVDVVDAGGATIAQYQLDLVKIHQGTTTNAARSAKSSKLAKVASVSGATVGSVRGLAGSATRSR